MPVKRSSASDFDAFVKGQQPAEPPEEPIDWNRERDSWLQRLNELYATIESFLAKYLKSGEIKREYREITLNEENIGEYTARRMILRIGRKVIDLTPAGTLLLGTKGRVDVVGPAGRTRLLLVEKDASQPQISVTVAIGGGAVTPPGKPRAKDINWTWKLATSAPRIQFIELTPESLFQALMEVANG